jgi:hypothetical protein
MDLGISDGAVGGIVFFAIIGALLEMLALLIFMICAWRFMRAFEQISESFEKFLSRDTVAPARGGLNRPGMST